MTNRNKQKHDRNNKPSGNHTVGVPEIDNSNNENQPTETVPEVSNFSCEDNKDTPIVSKEYLLNIVTDEMVCDSIKKSTNDLGLSNIIKYELMCHIKELVKKEVSNIIKDKSSKSHNLIQEILIRVNKLYFRNIQILSSDTPVKVDPPKLAVRPIPPPIEL